MSREVHKISVRKALAPRPEPYWAAPSARGLFLGYRKIDGERGSWVARLRDEETAKQIYHALGQETPGHDYKAAMAAMLAWVKSRDKGVSTKDITVSEACKQYVLNRERQKSEACAQDAKKRFERTVYGTTFGALQLARLKVTHVNAWRDSLGLCKASQNRTMTTLRAALNLAVKSRLVDDSVAREWGDVEQHKKADGRRSLFLDLTQRRALLNSATGSVRDLIEASMLLGSRPGELTSLTRGAFDARTQCVVLNGKTGERTIPLPPAALSLFIKLSKSKLPSAYLFTRENGMRWQHSDWDQLVRDAAKQAKLPKGVCLMTLRHSFITQSIMDGLSIMDVANFCGTSLAMVGKHYGQFVQNSVRERMKLVQML
jgi:site-specific recombinase XerD